MKSHTKYLTFNVPERMGFVRITDEVAEAKSAWRACARASASSTRCTSRPASSSTTTSRDCTKTTSAGSNDSRPSTPRPKRYQHNRTGEDNGDAHHKRQIMGREVVVAVTEGRLDLGPWEQIFYGEFDGRRAKRVLVKIIGQ